MTYGANAEELLILGCFPTLATIPVWIGLYQALSNVANEVFNRLGYHVIFCAMLCVLSMPVHVCAEQIEHC
jgi:membrane protein insertase Oxa1/YidC/SpoIIIJ